MESPYWLSEKVALGNSLGSSDFPSGLRPSGKSDDPQEFPRATFSRQPLRTFLCLYHREVATTLSDITVFWDAVAIKPLVFETFLKFGTLQCKLTFNNKIGMVTDDRTH